MKNLWSPKNDSKIISWDVDISAIQRHIVWTRRGGKLLQEIEYLDQYPERFGTFVFTMAAHDSVLQDIRCPQCGEIIGFKDNHFRCVVCDTVINPRHDARLRLVLTGRLRNLVGKVVGREFRGRPSIKKIIQKHKTLPSKWFVIVKNQVYFAPRIYALYSQNWNSSQPSILIEKSYFKEIGLSSWNTSDYHAYHQDYGGLLWLCIYQNWHPSLMGEVIHQRIVPKIIIDLMVSDLVAVGKLNKVLNELGETTHTIYNVIGRTVAARGGSHRFTELYNKYVEIDA